MLKSIIYVNLNEGFIFELLIFGQNFTRANISTHELPDTDLKPLKVFFSLFLFIF